MSKKTDEGIWAILVAAALFIGLLMGLYFGHSLTSNDWKESAFENDMVYFKNDAENMRPVLTWKSNDEPVFPPLTYRR